MILCLVLSLALAGHAIELEYISPEAKQQLEMEFDKAEFSSKDSAQLKQKMWTCDMYGVRTRLQVKRGVKLYHWKETAGWQNGGAQVVRDYRPAQGKLVGEAGRFEDQVKLNSKGQLVSRLSLTLPERQVISYAVCDAQL